MINFSDEKSFRKVIEIERISLNSTLNIQKNLNKQILIFMKNFISKIEISDKLDLDNISFQYIHDSSSTLKRSNDNISSIEELISSLSYILNLSQNNTDSFELNEVIESYNEHSSEVLNDIYRNTQKIEKFIHNISLLDTQKILEELHKKNISTSSESDTSDNNLILTEDFENVFIENTLVISDKQQKVFLPYSVQNLQKELLDSNSKYSSMQDIINKKYTKPLKYYSNASMARFKETYKLITKKEHGSKLKALALALELLYNYNLHPAIITACNNLNELDIYLACLDENKLDDFKFFNIKFEVPPISSENKIKKIFGNIKSLLSTKHQQTNKS